MEQLCIFIQRREMFDGVEVMAKDVVSNNIKTAL